MTLNIDFTPQEVAWINSQAAHHGLALAEIQRMVDERLPTVATPERPVEASAPINDANNAAAIALLQSWLAKDATEDPEEIRKPEEDLAEFKRNMNENSVAAGERLVYP